MAELLQFVFSGLTVGAIYALVALGFTLIYNASDIINFAQGEFVMLGGMTTVFLALAGVPLPLAALIAIAVTTGVGLALHRLAIEPARGASPVALIMITIGASVFLRGVAQIVFDKRFHSLPPLFGNDPIKFGGAAILPQSLVVLTGAAIIVILLWLFIERTLLGKAVIATAANRLAARLIGVNTRRIIEFSFAVSAAIGAVAGILITPIALDQLRRRHLAGPQGLCRGDARRHRQPARRRGRRAHHRHDRGAVRRLYLVELQGCRCLPHHSHRPRRHAAGPVRPGQSRAGMSVRALTDKRLLPVLAVAVIVIVLPLFFPSAYYYRVGALVFIFALAVVGLNLLMGFAGQVSLGHAGFLGIGAYAVAIGPVHFGMPSWLSLFVGAAISGAVAFAVGRPILRLKGHYLAVATLGFGLLVAIVLTNEANWTGGPDGMNVPALTLFGWRVRGSDVWYWISGATFVGGFLLALNLMDSPTGRALQAIHDSEIAARVLGIDVARKKLAVFIISAVYASVAGSFLALFNGLVTPDAAGFLNSIELVAMVVLGGMGSIFGSLVGAAVLVVLPQMLTVFHEYEQALLGLIVMVFMIFLRKGIVPSLAGVFAGWRK